MYIRFFALPFFLMPIGCASNEITGGDTSVSDRGGYFRVHVFDCEIEIPDEYSLRTNEQSRFRFSKSSNGVGSISIDNLDKDAFTSESLKIVDTKEIEELKILFLEASLGLNNKQPKDLVVIHNNKQAITIIGDDLNLWNNFIHTCSKTRKTWKEN